MVLDQKSTPIFRVTRGEPGLWIVTEEGIDKPLASFSSPTGARAYAREMTKARKDSMVQVVDEQSKQPPAKGWVKRKA